MRASTSSGRAVSQTAATPGTRNVATNCGHRAEPSSTNPPAPASSAWRRISVSDSGQMRR